MALVKICGKSFIVGDVVRVECSDGTEKIIRIERILSDGRFSYWDIFFMTSWEGVPAIALGEIDPKNVLAIWKVGSISDLMDINRNFFKLEPKTGAKIEFTTYMPASAQIDKTYSGRVYLFKIPTFGI